MYKYRITPYRDKAKGNKETFIFLSVTVEKKRHRVSTGLKIKPADWNTKARRTKDSQINAEITKYTNNIIEYLEDQYLRKTNPAKIDRLRIQEHMKGGKEAAKEDFINMWLKFLEYIKKDCIRLNEATVKGYIRWTKKLIGFEEHTGIRLSFNMSPEILNVDFKNYLVKTYDLNNSTINTFIKHIKVFLKWVETNGYANTRELIGGLKKLKVKEAGENITPLREHEIKVIEELDLSAMPKLDRTRDFFLMQCYSGQRFSDINNLNNASFYKEHIELYSVKTKVKSHIPYFPSFKKILDKYYNKELKQYDFPKLGYETYLNAIRTLAEMAGLNREVKYALFQGTNRIVIKKKLYEAIGTHSGRQTFITLSLGKNIPADVIMKVTGHKTHSSFKIYIDFANDDINRIVSEAWS